MRVQARADGGLYGLNDYLVRMPGARKYSSWRGPYIDQMKNDPFDRVYVVNVRAIAQAESDDAEDGGSGRGGASWTAWCTARSPHSKRQACAA